MQKSETRALDMLRSVRLHGQPRAAAFPANSRGGELYVSINTGIGNIERLSGEQAEHERNFREASKRKDGAEDFLEDLMVSINRTARSMSRTTPGAEEKFRLPPNRDGEMWLAAARAFATAAEPLADEFVRRNMAPDLVDDLKARILAVTQADDAQAKAENARIEATADLAAAIRQGLEDVRELDAIVRNTYAGNEAELAAWESASHVERAPRHAGEEEEEPPAPPTPPAQG
ncbi:MAG: hypothetical protein JOZ02_19130 [Acidobacteria bacterium]|nr:hypothetical protein [Acidobacteriota bacterium]